MNHFSSENCSFCTRKEIYVLMPVANYCKVWIQTKSKPRGGGGREGTSDYRLGVHSLLSQMARNSTTTQTQWDYHPISAFFWSISCKLDTPILKYLVGYCRYCRSLDNNYWCGQYWDLPSLVLRHLKRQDVCMTSYNSQRLRCHLHKTF